MDVMDKIMTPDMIRGAANMMSNMDPNVLNSMMSMTADMGFDPAEAKRAADKLRSMTTDEILALKSGAVYAPVPSGLVCCETVKICDSKRIAHTCLCVELCTCRVCVFMGVWFVIHV